MASDSDLFKTRARLLKASKIAAHLVTQYSVQQALREAEGIVQMFSTTAMIRARIEARAIPNSQEASEATWNVVLALLQVAKAGSVVLPLGPKPLTEGDRITTAPSCVNHPHEVKTGVFLGRTADHRVIWRQDGESTLNTSVPANRTNFKVSAMFAHEDGTPIDGRRSGFPA